jgi:mRNA interferase MazF
MIQGDVYLIKFNAPDKRRPALILTRTGAISELTSITVAPITTTVRNIPSHVFLDENDGMKTACAVNLDNVQTIDRNRLGSFMAHLSDERMQEVFEAIKFAFGFDR